MPTASTPLNISVACIVVHGPIKLSLGHPQMLKVERKINLNYISNSEPIQCFNLASYDSHSLFLLATTLKKEFLDNPGSMF